jgi:Protein of unknown function (DUF4232)
MARSMAEAYLAEAPPPLLQRSVTSSVSNKCRGVAGPAGGTVPRLIRIVTLTAAAVALVAGCTSQQPTRAPTPTSGHSATTLLRPSPTHAPTTSPLGAPATGLQATVPPNSATQRPSGIAVCTGRDMALGTAQGSGGHTGSGDFLLVFTNRGATACTMRGYPRVVAVHAGRAVRQAQPVPGSAPTVVLAAQGGQSAADINVWNLPLRPTSAPCGSATDVTLQVTPPGARVTLTITIPYLSTCDEAIKAVQRLSG